MSQSPTSSPQPEIPSMKAIGDELYQRLIDEHGYAKVEQSRIPGTWHVVAKDNVEVVALDFPYEVVLRATQATRKNQEGVEEHARKMARVEVSVRVPVDAREDKFFTTYECGDREYLGQRVNITLRTRDDIQARLGEIVELAQRGSAILQLCGKPMHDYLERPVYARKEG